MRGGDFDRWDLHFRGGLFGWARTRVTTEEHGGGRQLLRLHAQTHAPRLAVVVTSGLALLSLLAFVDHAWIAGIILGLLAAILGLLMLRDCAASRVTWAHAVQALKTSIDTPEQAS
jgi:hypothetical protein